MTTTQTNPQPDKNNKKTISEVGHAKNVANFNDLIAYCTAYGAAYNPPANNLKIASLNTLLTSAQSELSKVTTTKNTFDTLTGDRQLAFAALKPLATQVLNFIAITDATRQTLADAKTINNKLQGRRAKTITETPKSDDQPAPNTISVSRQSYDMLVENFSSLVDLASSIPSYTPNETQLTIPALTTFHENLQAVNDKVTNAEVAYSNARISRNNLLYNNAGLVNTALDIKKYIKAIFGSASPQYKQISGIKFTNRKD